MDREDIEKIKNFCAKYVNVGWVYISISILVTLFLFNSTALKVVSFSMRPTVDIGDVILVEGFSLRFIPPERGSVVVYKDPRQTEEPFVIKRVVGMPGDSMKIKDDILSIKTTNGLLIEYEKDSDLGRRDNGGDWSIELGPSDYLLMGDYRPGSKDGRKTGSIQLSEMYGRPYLRVWPISRIGLVR
jgi:signal peptidase I